MKASLPLSLPGTLLTVLFSLVLASVAQGQSTAARPDRGMMSGAAYSVSDLESVSLTNGNLNVSIPLASLPPMAGGRLGFTLSAVYNSKLWNVTRSERQRVSTQGCQSWVVDTPQLSDLGGWRISGHYAIVFRNAHADFDYIVPHPPGTQDCESNSQEQLLLQDNWYRAILIAPDGSEHELRPTDGYQYYSGSREYLRNYYNAKPDLLNAPMRYYSLDGSYLSAIINPSSYGTQWTVYMKDGTQVIQYSDGIQRIKDINGNSIKIYGDSNGLHYQDEQTGREIRYGADGKIWYQTVGGISQSIDIVWGTTTVQGKVYRVDAWNAEGGETGVGTACWHDEPLQTQLSVIREIVFPVTEPGQAGRRFTFNYNSDITSTASDEVQWACNLPPQTYTRTVSKGMGELDEITTPAGAVVKYSYSRDQVHNLGEPDEIAKGTVTQKAVTHDGLTNTWSYNIDEFGGTGGTVTAPDGSSTSESAYASNPGFGQYFGSGGKAGLVYRSSLSGKQIIERHWITTPFSGANGAATGALMSSTFNPLVDVEYLSIVNASGVVSKMSAKTYQYDYNGNLIQETDYDWFDPALVTRDSAGVPIGVPGGATVLRVINSSYYNPATSSSSENVYAKRSLSTATPLILGALQQATVGPSITQLSYDGQGYGMAPTAGNLTSQSAWDDLDNKWITSSQTYGLYGNLITRTDARGKVTQFFFDDATHAAPTRVVVDPENGSGQQTVTTAFDYATGLVTSQTDPNGKVTAIEYTNQLLGTVDPLGRPGVALGPVVNVNGVNQRHRTTTTYFDHLRQVIVASDLNGENDKLLKTRATSDMLGRVILSEQTEDGTNYTIFSRKAYEPTGKITYASSPMRYNTPSSTASWTRATTDTLSRITEVASFGGPAQPPAPALAPCPSEVNVPGYSGKVCTTYDANKTTVSDQTGRSRRSEVDALGRLISVVEDPNGLAFGTYYAYDALGNLTTVIQGGQTRTFTYDSLSRLRTATNPESGTVNYTYDDNGNLLTKTDARNVVSTYAYDAFNRNTSVIHSNDPAGTPAVYRYYDGFRAGVNNNIPNSKGRLWQTETSGPAGTRTTIKGFDPLGRPLALAQQFYSNNAWSASYTVQRVYGLAGQVLIQTYPSGHTVNYDYDSAGRTSSFAGNLGEGVPRTYSSEFQYTESGAIQQEKFGTDTPLYHKQRFNQRGQLWDMRLSTVPFATDAANGDRGAIVNYYSDNFVPGGTGADNNGNLLRQETNIPGSSYFQDNFSYDSLNRLQSISEKLIGTGSDTFKQTYTLDRWGNRTIDQDNTTANVPHPLYTVDTTNNRLLAPAGYTHEYDAVGNQTRDTYTTNSPTAGYRTFDAESRIVAAQKPVSGKVSWAYYTYNGDGQRVRRKIATYEIWQVYGFDGELLAEYPQNGPSLAVAQPQKEYGYHNGQLLVTTEPFVNAAWNKPATQTDNLDVTTTAAKAVNGDSDGTLADGSVAATNPHPNSWWQVDLQSVQAISSITIWARTDCCQEMTSDFYVFVSDVPFTSYDLNTTLAQPGVGNHRYLDYAGPASIEFNRTGRYVRVQLAGTQSLALAEVQVWSAEAKINWLVTDQLGTPRMIVDKTGSLDGVSRHDYLPFGEELGLVGGRTTTQGYSAADIVRQKFTQKERDNETGLDYFAARYHASAQGRFTSPDPFGPWAMSEDEKAAFMFTPQQWNRYTYCLNNPLKLIDPTGLEVYDPNVDEEARKNIHNALVEISKHGTKQQRVVASFILKNDVLIGLVHGDNSTIISNPAAANKRIDQGWTSMGEAGSYVRINIDSAIARPNSSERSAYLEGVLVHEGDHAYGDARTISSLSAEQGMNVVWNPTRYKTEHDAYVQEASYLLKRGGVHHAVGLDTNGIANGYGDGLLKKEGGKIGVNEQRIRDKLSNAPYRLNKEGQGQTTTQRTGLRPRS